MAIDSAAVEIVPDSFPEENTGAPHPKEPKGRLRLSVGAVSPDDIARGLPVLAAAR